jgi:hypothetical protein
MEDLLVDLETPPKIFSIRNTIICFVVMVISVCLNCYIIIQSVPDDDMLKIINVSRTNYLKGSFLGLGLFQLITLILSLLISFIPYKHIPYKSKLIRVSLIASIILHFTMYILIAFF